jgi:hypothetical protein
MIKHRNTRAAAYPVGERRANKEEGGDDETGFGSSNWIIPIIETLLCITDSTPLLHNINVLE